MAKPTSTPRDDELNGSSSNDLFTAGGGNDVMYGGDGIDRVVYRGSISQYKIKFLSGAIYVVKPDNTVDELHDIEQIQFGSDIFQLSEDHLTDALGDTRPMDLSYSASKKTYFLSTPLIYANRINLDILEADAITKSRISLFENQSVATAKILQLSAGGCLVFGAGNGKIAVTKINEDESRTSYPEIHLANSSSSGEISILGSNDTYTTLALTTWNGKSHISTIYRVNLEQGTAETLYQISSGYGSGAFATADGNHAHLYVGTGPIKTEPVWGGQYYDTEVWLKVTTPQGDQVLSVKLGGDEFITETYRTSLGTHDGKIVAGWIGLSYVLDENGGISGGANGVRVRQEGHFFAAIFDPSNPDNPIKFQVNQNPEDNALWSTSCELTGGELAFVWASNADGSGCGVYARIFDADGNALTDQFQVNSRTWDNQTSPIVVADLNGGFTVFWNDSYYGGAFQRFDNEGNPKLLSITGTAKADIVFADEGDQQILGGDGNDQISAGLGDDILLGGNGNDVLKPGAGDDIIIGGTGTNTIDYSNVEFGISLNLDSSMVSLGDDLQSISGIQNVNGTQFADTVYCSSDINVVRAGAGNDFVYGLAGVDTLYGDSGDDWIDGGAGVDMMFGGMGNDTYIVDSVSDLITEKPGEGIDTVQASLANFALAKLPAIDNILYTGKAAANLVGNTLANVITGNDGSDKIDGMWGADTMVGGAGNDTYLVDNSGDTIVENSGEGIDSVISGISYTLSANVENLILTGSKASTGRGNESENSLNGNSTANYLFGGDGNDTLDGGAGNDVLNGGAGADCFRFSTLPGKTNTDTIADFESGRDKIHLDDAIFKKFSALAGKIKVSQIVSGGSGVKALDSDDLLIYNKDTGALFYDSDGSGELAMTQFATLTGLPPLTAGDFILV